MANTPSAMPTMAKSRCGLALWAIVPWVKLSRSPLRRPRRMQRGKGGKVGNERRREKSQTGDRETCGGRGAGIAG